MRTFVSSANIGGEAVSTNGTWKIDGSKLAIVTTHETGREKPTPEETTAEFVKGRFTLSEKMEYPVVLQRMVRTTRPHLSS